LSRGAQWPDPRQSASLRRAGIGAASARPPPLPQTDRVAVVDVFDHHRSAGHADVEGVPRHPSIRRIGADRYRPVTLAAQHDLPICRRLKNDAACESPRPLFEFGQFFHHGNRAQIGTGIRLCRPLARGLGRYRCH
jgi:hypothetical protein